jgi:hypothetical protein
MGSWGLGPFENDTACDWGYDLEKSTDLSVIERALDSVVEARDYLEAPAAEEALAAAEVVARLQGNWGPRTSYTETVDAWVKKTDSQITSELASKAVAAINRVLTPPSELLELWQDTDDFDTWKKLLGELAQRVAAYRCVDKSS